SVTLAASPDTLNNSGSDQSSITITAKDASGNPVANQTFHVDTKDSAGVLRDLGTLSRRTVVTGSDGVATVVFTAPSGSVNSTPFEMSIVATPFGTNSATTSSQSVQVRVNPV